jgi:hypothetical protein
MSPRYEPDLTKVTAGIEIFPKGTYEFSIGEPKAFSRENRQGVTTVGTRYPLRCEMVHAGDQNFKNKRTLTSLYLHTEEAQGMAKRFIMAALGFNGNQEGEQTFDAEYKGRDWSLDPEVGSVGDVWREPTGRRVLADCDSQIVKGDDGTERTFQSFNWIPLRKTE